MRLHLRQRAHDHDHVILGQERGQCDGSAAERCLRPGDAVETAHSGAMGPDGGDHPDGPRGSAIMAAIQAASAPMKTTTILRTAP